MASLQPPSKGVELVDSGTHDLGKQRGALSASPEAYV